LTGVVEDKRLRGDIEVDERAEMPAEGAEKTLEGGFEIGVSRSDENSKPGKFPKWSASGGREVAVEVEHMLLMYVEIDEIETS
jgi:hypothetical protein